MTTMKTYIAKKPYYIVLKDDKFVTGSKIVIGRNVTSDATVEWFATESEYNARLAIVKPKPPIK